MNLLSKKIVQYININENGIAGQDARTKEWFCKEIPFKDADDLKKKAIAINKVLNELNQQEKTLPHTPTKKKKDKKPPVKGLH